MLINVNAYVKSYDATDESMSFYCSVCEAIHSRNIKFLSK